MLEELNNVAVVPAANFVEQIFGKLVEPFLEETMVAIGRGDIAAAYHVAKPEHRKKISVLHDWLSKMKNLAFQIRSSWTLFDGF